MTLSLVTCRLSAEEMLSRGMAGQFAKALESDALLCQKLLRSMISLGNSLDLGRIVNRLFTFESGGCRAFAIAGTVLLTGKCIIVQ